MKRTEIGRIVQGQLYFYHDLRVVKRDGNRSVEETEGGRFRVASFAFDAVTRRDLVVYVGLDEGYDHGRLYVASPNWFARHFRAAPVETPAEPEASAEEAPAPTPEPIPEKVAGMATAGSGW
jgi:hypothetical protein